jgi:hypothetical protein
MSHLHELARKGRALRRRGEEGREGGTWEGGGCMLEGPVKVGGGGCVGVWRRGGRDRYDEGQEGWA